MSKEDYAMTDSTSKVLAMPGQSSDPLTETLRRGARELLAQAIQAEAEDYIETHKAEVDERGRRMVVRNGSMPERKIQPLLGQIAAMQPRINDSRVEENALRQRKLAFLNFQKRKLSWYIPMYR